METFDGSLNRPLVAFGFFAPKTLGGGRDLPMVDILCHSMNADSVVDIP